MNIRDYMNKNKQVATFGVKYLDDTLGGVLKSDLIVMGARSGAGKSTLSNIIAMANNDKKITLFSLENFEGDDLAKETFHNYINLTQNFNMIFRKFVAGHYKLEDVFLDKAEQMARKTLSHINLICRTKDYKIDRLKHDMIKAVEDGSELIILDHLDYLDKDNPADNENSHITELMKTIREIQDVMGCAVIAVSHLRKPANAAKNMPVVPSVDEFIGSSNKVKEATVVIMLAPDDEDNQNNVDSHCKSTWCCIRKNRFGGIDNKVARMYFNTRTGRYQDGYNICSVNYSGTEVNTIEKRD